MSEFPPSEFPEHDTVPPERQERQRSTRERMRLLCGTVALLREKTGCALADAAECVGDTESHIADWQAILASSNDPPPDAGTLYAFFLTLPIAQRRGIMERLCSNGKTKQKPEQPERPKQPELQRLSKQPKTPLSCIYENARQNHRAICAMADYLHEQFELLFKDAANALDTTPQYLSLLRSKVKERGGRGMPQEQTLLTLARRIGMERLTDLAEQSPRVKRMRGEDLQKPPSPKNEYIENDWRRVCAMIDVLRTQFALTTQQAFAIQQTHNLIRFHLQNFFIWQRKFARNGGHGIPSEEALLLLAKKLGMEELTRLADTLPRIQKKRTEEEAERKLLESYSQEEAEWRILVAVELLLEAGISEPLARAAMDVSEATFERYWQKFRQRERTPEDRARAASLVLDLFDGEVPKEPEEIQWRLAKLYGNRVEASTHRFRNVIEAALAGAGDRYEGFASDDFAPTDAFPGTLDKSTVIHDRIHRGDPSGFHPLDRCAYIDMKRADFIRDAIAKGMEK